MAGGADAMGGLAAFFASGFASFTTFSRSRATFFACLRSSFERSLAALRAFFTAVSAAAIASRAAFSSFCSMDFAVLATGFAVDFFVDDFFCADFFVAFDAGFLVFFSAIAAPSA